MDQKRRERREKGYESMGEGRKEGEREKKDAEDEEMTRGDVGRTREEREARGKREEAVGVGKEEDEKRRQVKGKVVGTGWRGGEAQTGIRKNEPAIFFSILTYYRDSFMIQGVCVS